MAEERASLLDWATGLASDPALRLRFAQEPRAVLDEQGLADVPPADLHHSLPLVTDSVAARLGTEVDATVLAAAAVPLDGESAADTLARQFGAATDSVLNSPAVLHDPPEPDPSADHTLQETTMSTPAATPGSTDDHADLLARLHDVFDDLAAHGVSASGNTPEGWLDSVGPDAAHRLLDSYDLGDLQGDAATARTNELFSAALQPPVVDNGSGREAELDAPAADPAVGDRTPGTPQGQHALELEAQSHGYPSAEAYVSDAELTSGLRNGELAWEPQNGNAAYGQLQNYMDAAAAQGIPVGDYAAQHHYSPEEIDAALAGGGSGTDPDASFGADTDLDDVGPAGTTVVGDAYAPHGNDPFDDLTAAGGGSSAGAEDLDTDLDDLGAAGTPAAGGSTWTPQPDDPFIGWGDGTGGAGSAPAAAEADLDGFGSSSSSGGDGYVPHGDDPFADMVEAQGGSMTPGLDGDFGSSSGTEGESFGSGGDSSGGDDSFGATSSADDGSSYDDGSGFAGHEDVSAPEPAHEDAGAHDAADHGDADPHDAADDSSDYSESFG